MTDNYQGLLDKVRNQIKRPTTPTVPQPTQAQVVKVDPTSNAEAKTYNAAQNTVTGDQTVQKQLAGLLDKGGAYIDNARQRGIEFASDRNLRNSSIAAGAAERSAIEAGLPIAQQDAQTYADVASANTAAQNEALGQNARLGTDVTLANQEAKNRGSEVNATLGTETSLANAEAANILKRDSLNFQHDIAKSQQDTYNQTNLMEFDSTIRQQLAAIEQDYALELENLSQSYEIAKNADTAMGGMYGEGLKSIAHVLENADLETDEKEAAVEVIIGNLQSGLEFLSGVSGGTVGANLGGTGGATPGGIPSGVGLGGSEINSSGVVPGSETNDSGVNDGMVDWADGTGRVERITEEEARRREFRGYYGGYDNTWNSGGPGPGGDGGL